MAKRGSGNTIGEANVIITGDVADLKGKVAEAKKEVEGIGKGRRRGRGAGGEGGAVSEARGEITGIRRILSIGAFVAATGAAFFKLGQTLREIVTRERTYNDALSDRSELLRKTAEEESKGLEQLAQDLNFELERLRTGDLFTQWRQQLVNFVKGRPESVLERLLEEIRKQQAQATTRLASEKARTERLQLLQLNQRILEALENFREQQRQVTDRALAQQQVAAARLEQIIELRANLQRR